MLSINTNLSSLITQSSLKTSTLGLNQAIERMTTGFKINHAKDNAAGYSISTNMSTKISAYQVAEDNAAMGLDMVTTASESLSQIEDLLSRLRALTEQANNGTYGEDSLKAINSEVNAIVDEIQRIQGTTEYNGIDLFGETVSGFIQEVARRETSGFTKMSGVDETQALAVDTYSISTAEDLAKLARMTNNGLIAQGTEFVLANNIDLSAYSSGEGWTPIGTMNPGDTSDTSVNFRGIFDGNGYTISNLYINRNDKYQGLFGRTYQAEIKNVGMENVDVTAALHAGGLVGSANDTDISNCTVFGNVVGCSGRGLLLGAAIKGSTVEYCYSSGNVIAGTFDENTDNGGGLIGLVMNNVSVRNSFSDANVIGAQNGIGGFIGTITGNNIVENCYSSGSVNGQKANRVGGFVGTLSGSICKNCYSNLSSFINGEINIGGFAGSSSDNSTIEGCYVFSKNDNIEGIFTGINNQVYVENSYYSSYYDGIGVPIIGSNINGATSSITNVQSYDGPVPFEYELHYAESEKKQCDLQIGTSSNEHSQISLETQFSLNGISDLRNIGLYTNKDYLSKIDAYLSTVSAKQTEYGAVQNRLMSAMEEISIQYENLVSSLSTIRDADIAEESSSYIKMQILQQASATLMATANQSPSIALQLI